MRVILMRTRFMIIVMVFLMDDLRNYVNDLVEDAEHAPERKCIQYDISCYPQISSSLLPPLIIAKLIQSLLAVFI
jgi:hypothetical protein